MRSSTINSQQATPDKLYQSQSSSLLFADIDLSRLDSKRQMDLANLMLEKDRLITEKSEKHKEVLQDIQLLREDYIMKETELERMNKAYSDLKVEVYQYKEKMRLHHEEIVSRLKQTEEVVKELACYITSMCKLNVGVSLLANKAVSELK